MPGAGILIARFSYDEYAGFFLFGFDDGVPCEGGDRMSIVVRKSDGATLPYAPIFLNFDIKAEDVGDVIACGTL